MMSADLGLSATAPAPGGAPSPAEQRHALDRLGKAQRAKEDWAGKAAAEARERQARRLLIEAAGGEPTADFEFLDSWSRELACRIEAVIEYRSALERRREIVEMIERGARLEEVAQSQAELEAIARWRKLGRGPAERELERAMDALVRLNDRQGKIERLKAKLAG